MPLRPPGPGPFYFFNRLPRTMEMLASRYGDMSSFRVFGMPALFVNHPDLIREVLVTQNAKFAKSALLRRLKVVLGEGLLTSEPPLHTQQRRLMQPAFHHRRIAAYAQVMSDYATRHQTGWQTGATVDMHAEMMRLTLAIVGKTLFDADVEGTADEVGRIVHTLSSMSDLINFPWQAALAVLPFGPARTVGRELAALDGIIYRFIEQRRAEAHDRGDLLSMLVLAQDDETRPMSNQQVRDEALTLFLAGHETTANALTWTFHLLTQHPAALAALHAELDTVLAGRAPTADDVPQLPFTRMVLSEAMRLYPPAWIISRQAKEPFHLNGYDFDAGTLVFLSQWTMHRDARYYPNPSEFHPERWQAEAAAARPKFAYFPFGGGARVCIGEPFAWMEGVLLLAALAQGWQFHAVPGARIELHPAITLRPRHGLPVRLERRIDMTG